jgi:hypothetical protein
MFSRGNLSQLVRETISRAVAFFELSVEAAHVSGDREHSFLDYVLSTFKQQRLDLIVTDWRAGNEVRTKLQGPSVQRHVRAYR